jgi:hypothetical protein
VLRLGVYRLDQLRAGANPLVARNRIAFHLLNEAQGEARTRLFEQIAGQIMLSGGVYRTTSRGRFERFDPFLNEVLAGHFEPSRALEIEDWAASDCATSAEWAQALWQRFPEARVTASDLTLSLIEVQLPDGDRLICEKSGEGLQYVRPPFVVRLVPPEHGSLLINRMVVGEARRKLRRVQEIWKKAERWLSSDEENPFELPPYVLRKISLIHPAAEALRRGTDRFRVKTHSAFEPLAQPCDVIRTMNILNLQYFPEEKLRSAIAAIRASLRENGIWIVGRTVAEQPPAQDASVFVAAGNGFQPLARQGKGSEIAHLVR